MQWESPEPAFGAGAIASASAEVATVRIERVLLVLGRVKLEKAPEGLADFVDETSVVVSLTPGGGPVLAPTADVPSDTY